MLNARDYFRPEPVTERPAEGERHDSVIRSYLLMRAVIGILGVLLPLVLLFGDSWLLQGNATARGSLSAYYHSGMRDYFVGTLLVVGFCLLIYKVFERSLDNTLTFFAGIAAIGVAFFPTKLPPGGGPLTSLQDRLGEGRVETIHYSCAFVLFISLAIVSWFFGRREGARGDRPKMMRGPHPEAKVRRAIHQTCAVVVTAAVAFIFVTRVVDIFGAKDLLIGESVAIMAFGISWAYKGLELDMLFPSRLPRSSQTVREPLSPASRPPGPRQGAV